MTFYLTSIDTFFLSRSYRFWDNLGQTFEGRLKWRNLIIPRWRLSIDIFISSYSHQTALIDVSLIKIGLAFLAAPSSKSVTRLKKNEPFYFGHMYLRPGQLSQNQILMDYSGWLQNQSCQIFSEFVDSDVFARGQTLSFSVQAVHGCPLRSVVAYYQNIVLSWCYLNCSIMWAGQTELPGPVWRVSSTMYLLGQLSVVMRAAARLVLVLPRMKRATWLTPRDCIGSKFPHESFLISVCLLIDVSTGLHLPISQGGAIKTGLFHRVI